MSGESASERWTPSQRVESVLISVLSLLDDAEVSSPANVDAGVMLRKEPEQYKAMVKKDLERVGIPYETHEGWLYHANSSRRIQNCQRRVFQYG